MPDPIPLQDGLQIDEDRAFQNRFWNVQRGVWLAFGLFLAAAALGLMGRSGHFATARVTLGTAELTYPRITHLGAPAAIDLVANSAASPELALGPELATLFQIETILPRPAMESGGDALRFAFFPDGHAPYRVQLSLRSQHPGLIRYPVSFGGETVTATTLVLP